MTPGNIARGLAWFGIGLGVVELLAPRKVARAAGLEGHETTLALFGLREIASGVVVLAADDPCGLLWVRVVGDALDGALLASRLGPSNPHAGRTLAAALAIAPVALLDAVYAKAPRGAPSRPPSGPSPSPSFRARSVARPGMTTVEGPGRLRFGSRDQAVSWAESPPVTS